MPAAVRGAARAGAGTGSIGRQRRGTLASSSSPRPDQREVQLCCQQLGRLVPLGVADEEVPVPGGFSTNRVVGFISLSSRSNGANGLALAVLDSLVSLPLAPRHISPAPSPIPTQASTQPSAIPLPATAVLPRCTATARPRTCQRSGARPASRPPRRPTTAADLPEASSVPSLKTETMAHTGVRRRRGRGSDSGVRLQRRAAPGEASPSG